MTATELIDRVEHGTDADLDQLAHWLCGILTKRTQGEWASRSEWARRQYRQRFAIEDRPDAAALASQAERRERMRGQR